MPDLKSLKAKLKKYWPILLIAAAILIFLAIREKNLAPEQEVLPTGITGTQASPDTGTAQTPEDTGTEWLPVVSGDTSEDAGASSEASGETLEPIGTEEPFVTEDGEYSDKEHVAYYLHTYNRLPGNYITKEKAEAIGWVASKGNLWKVAPGKSIGGSRYGNYEGLLPKKKGRQYYECDIDYGGKSRNAKRIVWSNDGLIYYTDDHYESFELLYGEP